MFKLSLIPLFGILLGCATMPLASPNASMKLYFDDAAMRAEVEKYISVGMPLDKAKKIMQDNGFECEVITYESGLPRLRCLAIYKLLRGIVTHFGCADEIWVNLYYDAGVVKEIKVRCQTCGP